MRAFAVFVGLLAAFAAPPAMADEPRIALVVGNRSYTGGLDELNNSLNDAKLIARELASAGFDVEPVQEADMADLTAALERFTNRLREAGPGAVGLFYFAGHGLQYHGTNYLFPTDASVDDPADIPGTGLDQLRVLWAMQDGGARTSIVIVDACRQERVSKTLRPVAEQGLAQFNSKGFDKKRSRLIIYSTGGGEAATDGDKTAGNSPFAVILAENMRVPNQNIFDMITHVTAEMVETADQKPTFQADWLREKFAFVSAP